MPGNAADSTEPTTYRTRSRGGLQPKRCAMPPTTPASTRSLIERVRAGLAVVFMAVSVGARAVYRRDCEESAAPDDHPRALTAPAPPASRGWPTALPSAHDPKRRCRYAPRG